MTIFEQSTKRKKNNNDNYLQWQSLNICDKPPSPSPSSYYSLLAGRPAAATWKKQFRKVFFSSLLFSLQIIRKGWTDNHEMCIGQWRIHIPRRSQKIIFNLFNWQGFCRKMKYAGCSCVLLRLDERSLHFWSKAKKVVRCTWRAGCQRTMLPVTDYSFQDS